MNNSSINKLSFIKKSVETIEQQIDDFQSKSIRLSIQQQQEWIDNKDSLIQEYLNELTNMPEQFLNQENDDQTKNNLINILKFNQNQLQVIRFMFKPQSQQNEQLNFHKQIDKEQQEIIIERENQEEEAFKTRENNKLSKYAKNIYSKSIIFCFLAIILLFVGLFIIINQSNNGNTQNPNIQIVNKKSYSNTTVPQSEQEINNNDQDELNSDVGEEKLQEGEDLEQNLENQNQQDNPQNNHDYQEISNMNDSNQNYNKDSQLNNQINPKDDNGDNKNNKFDNQDQDNNIQGDESQNQDNQNTNDINNGDSENINGQNNDKRKQQEKQNQDQKNNQTTIDSKHNNKTNQSNIQGQYNDKEQEKQKKQENQKQQYTSDVHEQFETKYKQQQKLEYRKNKIELKDLLTPMPQNIEYGDGSINVNSFIFEIYEQVKKWKPKNSQETDIECSQKSNLDYNIDNSDANEKQQNQDGETEYKQECEEFIELVKIDQENSDIDKLSYYNKKIEWYNEQYMSFNIHNKDDEQRYEDILVKLILENVDQPKDFKDPEKTDESYEIIFDKNAENGDQYEVQLICKGYVSFIRAMETLHQLVQKYQKIHFLPIKIQDEPYLKYRGLMIDTARHFVALEKLMNHVDAMRINKFNIMHLHLTDADSFHVEIPEIPELSQYGANSQDYVYTEQDMIKLQAHARENGVLIIPEFDAPAHTLSWAMSEKYQEINSCGYLSPRQWGQCGYQAPCGTINPIHEKTWEVVKAIVNYTETIFDTDVYHIGADEVKTTCWKHNQELKQFCSENGLSINQLEDWFLQKMVDLYQNQNKKVIYWKVNKNSKNLTQNDIFQYWGSTSRFQKNINYKVIVSPSNVLYLDCGRGNLFGSTGSWCGKLKTWDFLYRQFSIYPYGLDKNNLLGAIAPLWSERVNSDQLDALLYPRTISLALKFWNYNEHLKNQQLAQKIVFQNDRLKKIANIKAGAIASRFCELNTHLCFFK